MKRFFLTSETSVGSSYDKRHSDYQLKLSCAKDDSKRYCDIEIVLKDVESIDALLSELTDIKKSMLIDLMDGRSKYRGW